MIVPMPMLRQAQHDTVARRAFQVAARYARSNVILSRSNVILSRSNVILSRSNVILSRSNVILSLSKDGRATQVPL